MAAFMVDGIKVSVSAEKFGCSKTVRFLANIQKGQIGDIFDLFDFVFGEGKFDEVEAKFANETSGLTQMDDIMDWFNRVADKVGVKN